MLARLAAATVAALALGSAPAQPGPLIHLAQGFLEGRVNGASEVFYDIPYAAAPVGPLRWRAPQAAPGWIGVRAADAAGPACIQTEGGSGYHGPESEDCLHLNVFVPRSLRPGAHAPVMVWIHGGGFVGGAGSRYDGSAFVRDGVILVTINYRLGRLGFFAHPALAAASPDGALANFGLMDQVAALRWVQANIAAFGGDASNVTVFGESAGAGSVDALLATPLAKGLFARAISQSSFAGFPLPTLVQATVAASRYANALGVKGSGADAAAALRALPTSAFTKPSSPTDLAAPRPILDGVVLTLDPSDAFARGEQIKVPLITGGNSFDASQFIEVIAANPRFAISFLGGDPQKVLADNPDAPVRAAADYLTATRVLEPDRRMAQNDARAGVPAWTYVFAYVPAAVRAQTLGAWHGEDVPYVFDSLDKDPHPARPQPQMPMTIPGATPDDEAIARAIHAYWVAFAKTGRPEPAGLPHWPAVSIDHANALVFGDAGPRVGP